MSQNTNELEKAEASELVDAILDGEEADPKTMYHGQGRGHIHWFIVKLYELGFVICVKE